MSDVCLAQGYVARLQLLPLDPLLLLGETDAAGLSFWLRLKGNHKESQHL